MEWFTIVGYHGNTGKTFIHYEQASSCNEALDNLKKEWANSDDYWQMIVIDVLRGRCEGLCESETTFLLCDAPA